MQSVTNFGSRGSEVDWGSWRLKPIHYSTGNRGPGLESSPLNLKPIRVLKSGGEGKTPFDFASFMPRSKVSRGGDVERPATSIIVVFVRKIGPRRPPPAPAALYRYNTLQPYCTSLERASRCAVNHLAAVTRWTTKQYFVDEFDKFYRFVLHAVYGRVAIGTHQWRIQGGRWGRPPLPTGSKVLSISRLFPYKTHR